MKWFKDFIVQIGNAIGLDRWTTAYIGLALTILVIAAIVIIIVVACKKKAKKKQAAKVETAQQPAPAPKQEVKPVPAEQPAEVKAEEAKAEEVVSAAAEEPAETPAEEPAKEEKKAAKPVAKPAVKKQVTKEQPKTEKAAAKPKTEKAAAKPAEKPVKKQAEKPAKPVAKPAPAPVKAAPVKAEKPAKKPVTKEPKPKALGKWVVEQKSEDEFISLLSASNGEVMLTSETYASEDGARKGIATIIKAVESGEFVTHKTKNGTFYFKLKSAGNRLLCAGEIYKDKTSCENAVESVKRIAAESPVVKEVAEGEKYVAYKPLHLSKSDIDKAMAGKWKIETTEDGKFFATLYASNGQVMISTEEVATKASAVAGMENAKKNALLGNFVIDKDKFGKFYYKLRNANKSVICIGESYPSAERCISALESVRKLATKSQIAE